jgi:hypothetical protein
LPGGVAMAEVAATVARSMARTRGIMVWLRMGKARTPAFALPGICPLIAVVIICCLGDGL